MKIWFDYCNLDNYFIDEHVKLGIGWYKHNKKHKWKGFTVQIYLYFWMVNINYVNNWLEYDKRINYIKYRTDSKKYE